jgi:3-dehydroquinate synthase
MSDADDGATFIAVGGPAPYDVVVGHGLTGRLAPLVDGAATVAVAHPRSLEHLARPVVDHLAASGHRVVTFPVDDGESAKSLDVAAAMWDALGNAEMTRSDAVVAVGGGATTDVAGFVAATWLRGVRVVHLPTTLLGMVDAAIGGKTAINTGAGKNLVGAFHPPAGVLVDLDVLATLPAEEWVNGMAEVVKAGFIADPHILALVDDDPLGARTAAGPHTRELVERSIRMKADVVSKDFREAGLREMLNYGHTLGHAIERAEGYRWPHGHAVSVGMVFVAELARLTGRLDDDTAKRHRTVLESVGLPTRYDGAAWPVLHDAMRVDKKARGHRIRFVLLDGLAKPTVVDAPDDDVLEAAFAAVTA